MIVLGIQIVIAAILIYVGIAISADHIVKAIDRQTAAIGEVKAYGLTSLQEREKRDANYFAASRVA